MRLSSMMWVVVVVCAASLLYSVKYRVQSMDEEIASLHAQIKEERAAIHVLHAEWAYETRPERVRILAEQYLKTEPQDGKQMLELADVPFSPDSPIRMVEGGADIAPYGDGVQPVAMRQYRPDGGDGYVR